MKGLTIQVHKGKSVAGRSEIFLRVIQEIGLVAGIPPKHGAFLEEDAAKVFTGFMGIEGYILAFLDQNLKDWDNRMPGILCSFAFDENDFKGPLIDGKKVLEKMYAAERAAKKNQRPTGFCKKCNESVILQELLKQFKDDSIEISGCCPICFNYVRSIFASESRVYDDFVHLF